MRSRDRERIQPGDRRPVLLIVGVQSRQHERRPRLLGIDGQRVFGRLLRQAGIPFFQQRPGVRAGDRGVFRIGFDLLLQFETCRTAAVRPRAGRPLSV